MKILQALLIGSVISGIATGIISFFIDWFYNQPWHSKVKQWLWYWLLFSTALVIVSGLTLLIANLL